MINLAEILFIVGSLIFIWLGALHMALSFADDFKPRKFTPTDDQVRVMMTQTALKLDPHANMWRAWLGFNISHGLGTFFFGLIYAVIAIYDFALLVSFVPLIPLAILIAFVYFLLAVRYWFPAPAVGAGLGLASFVVTYLLI